jgi:hypothetical protein
MLRWRPQGRFVRGLTSLVLVAIAFCAYRLAVVPMIEPSVRLTPRADAGGPTGTRPIDLQDEQMRQLAYWFKPGDWELEKPKVLENSKGKLLLQDYKNLGDGRVRIQPCTMVFLPEREGATEEERMRGAIILQSPEGAVLQFDQPFDLRRGNVGKLVSGRLEGPITIRSDHRLPGPTDDVYIETRDLDVLSEMISTPNQIKFRYGSTRGSGREMRIELLPAADATAGKQYGPQVGGIKAFWLGKNVQVRMLVAAKSLDHRRDSPAAGRVPPVFAGSPGQQTPVEVSCRGPFRFDLQQQVCTFHDQVDVLRVRPDGPGDQLACQTLSVYFEPRPEPGATPPPDPSTAKNPARLAKLQASRMEARGEPVTIRSPLEQIHARCQILEYDLATRRVGLRGTTTDIELYRADLEIHARELHYEPGEPGRVGRFLAVGRGWMKGNVPDESGRQFEVRWSKELRSRPDGQEMIVSLQEDAYVDMPGTGMLSANQIHAWLTELTAEEASRPLPDGSRRERLVPNRMLAQGHVRFDSAQLTGATEKLEVWFTPGGAAAAALPLRGRGRIFAAASRPVTLATHRLPRDRLVLSQFRPAQRQGPPRVGRRDVAADQSRAAGPVVPLPPGLASGQKFEVSGSLLRVQLRLVGRQAELLEVVVEGTARFAEIETAQPGEKPLLVQGERLHVARPDPNATTVTVTGQPAHVEGRGLALNGSVINMDQGTNRVWIDGGGSMTLLVDRAVVGPPLGSGDGRQPLDVAWRGRMNFDGRQAIFEGTVEAARQNQLLQTEFLEVLLDRRIDFAAPKQATQPQVELVRCRDGVNLTNRSFDEQGLSSIERLQAADLSLNHITGEIYADGPGWLTRVNRGSTTQMPALPGARADEPPAVAPGDKQRDGINYLKVRFQQSLSGNMQRRQMRFSDQVHAVYGPVATWEGELDPNKPQGLGANGILLTCDQLDVIEMPDPGIDQRHVEMEASGNTFVEGQTFTARANRMTYHQTKDMLVLEGSGRASAELSHQKRVGGPVSNLAAGKILYWRQSNRVEVDDAKFLDLGQMRSEKPKKQR